MCHHASQATQQCILPSFVSSIYQLHFGNDEPGKMHCHNVLLVNKQVNR